MSTITLPKRGDRNWDRTLNAALSTLNADKVEMEQVTQEVAEAVADHVDAEDPHGDRADAASRYLPQAQITVDDLVESTPFYIAHRGAGGEYPEHTLAAYSSAVAAGAQAIEVSCHASADGVLFAFHDTTWDRMTDFTGSTTGYPWSVIREQIKVDASGLLGPGWSPQTIPTVREVLDRFLGKVVIFIEAKSNPAVPLLQRLLLQYPGANKSVVWKGYYKNTGFQWAHDNGFRTWAYIDLETTSEQLDQYDGEWIDYWGVPSESSDSQIAMVVGRGKKTIAWEVHRRSERDRLVSLGVHGIMCSQFSYVTHPDTSPILTAAPSSWKVKAPGDIGVDKGNPNYALQWDTTDGGVYCPALSGHSVLLGSRSCMTDGPNGYRISFMMRYPVLPASTLHGGLYFGADDDSRHQFSSTVNKVGGYRFLLRGNGDMQLYRYDAGVASGTVLGAENIGPLEAGAWYRFEIDVTATQVIVRNLDTSKEVAVSNTAYRGRYFGIHNGSISDTATIPRFDDITTSKI